MSRTLTRLMRRALYAPNLSDLIEIIEPSEAGLSCLPIADEWHRAGQAQRAIMLKSVLIAECHELIEETERMVTVPDPLATVGTRD